MSVEGPNGERKQMASREWSTETLQFGMDSVFTDVKSEPWVDASDEELKDRLKASLRFLCPKPFIQIASHATT